MSSDDEHNIKGLGGNGQGKSSSEIHWTVREKAEREERQLSASEIARALNGKPCGTGEWLCRCPVPEHEDKHPSFCVGTGENGKPVFVCYSGCQQDRIIDALKAQGLWRGNGIASTPDPETLRQERQRAEDAKRRKLDQVRAIYYGASDTLDGTPAEAYLRSRGIWDARSDDFRFGEIPHKDVSGRVPALIVPRIDHQTNDLVGIQRIYLNDDGTKFAGGCAKVSLGSGGIAKLHIATHTLVLAEGVETAIAAGILFHRPAWAFCGGFPREVWLPPEITDVLLAADHDAPVTENGHQRITSQHKAEALAKRIRASGRTCEVRMPEEEGTDWNDFLLGGGEMPDSKPQRDETGASTNSADMPRICCSAGRIADATQEAFSVLVDESNPFTAIYVRGRMLMRVVRYKKNGKSKDAVNRAEGSTLLNPVCLDWLTYHLDQKIEWFGFKKLPKSEGGGIVEVLKDAPERISRNIMADEPWKGLPILKGIINAPTILLDGRVIQEPGYDEDSGLLFDPDGATFPQILENPTEEDARKALKVLENPFAEFPFRAEDGDKDLGEAYRSVALSSILTALVRRSISIAPQFAFTATTPSSGKTLIASLPSIVATGLPPMTVAPSPDPESEKKALLSALIEGPNSILVDNLEGEYGSATLNAILTTEEYSDRLLGSTKQVSVPTNSVFLCTGNNLVIRGDLGVRTLLCRLDPEKENPDARPFKLKEDLRKWVAKHRGELAVAAITIIKAYIAAGSPKQDGAKNFENFGRFDEWQRLCRFPLMWLGCADPYLTQKGIKNDNPEIRDLRALLDGWQECFKTEAKTVGAAIAICDAPSASEQQKVLIEAFAAVGQRGPKISARAVGKFIAKSAGRIIDGKRFVKNGTEQRALAWCVDVIDTKAASK